MRAAAGHGAAVLVALLLSGAPRAISAALATDGDHRCQCASHGTRHVCACPVCRARARAARRDATKALPPCHRDAALTELDEDERAERSPGPCLRPSCGADPERAAGPPATDAFTLLRFAALVAFGSGRVRWTAAMAAGDRALEPPLPPPRRS